MRFEIEPVGLHRGLRARAKRDPAQTFALIQRQHWIELAISLLTIAGGVGGSHGWLPG
jgi:hypothetical protein